MLPFFNVIPGVYGPVLYPVKKTANGFYIKGYSNEEFTGSIKEIAQKILWKLVNAPEGKPRLHYVGPFSINFWPEMQCGLCMDPDPDPPDLDIGAFNKELTEELKSYITITVDKNIITPYVTMANFPLISHKLSSCGPPLPVNIQRDGVLVLKTDNCGLEFEVIGDKYTAAVAFLEYATKDANQYGYMFDHERTNFTHRIGAIDFKIVDKKIQDVEAHFQTAIPHVTYAPENRVEVLETVKIIKSVLKVKAFL